MIRILKEKTALRCHWVKFPPKVGIYIISQTDGSLDFFKHFSFNEFMLWHSSSLYCQMALFLRRLILILKRMCLLGTSTFWVRFCPLKQYRIFSICYCGKWQVASNLEGSGHNLAVGGEVEISLSDLGRVRAKPTPDKGTIWLSRFWLRKDRCSETIPPSKKGWPLIKAAALDRSANTFEYLPL